MVRSIPSVLFVVVAATSVAQTMFIPDLTLRAALNSAKPNSVDVNGQCDTLAWNAHPPTQVDISVAGIADGGTLDLAGIQYLKMDRLEITDNAVSPITVLWPGYPRNNTRLTVRRVDVTQFNGPFFPLSNSLGYFTCTTCGLTEIPAFNGISMNLQSMDFSGQVLTVPPSLITLYLVDLNISQSPAVANLTALDISDNPLADWTNLPGSLQTLYANNVGLNYLPALAPPLAVLGANNNALTALPTLPSTLITLDVTNNQLTELPALPALSGLYVSDNPITALPPLPPSLFNLYINSCPITALSDPLPTGLSGLYADGSGLITLPSLPLGLQVLVLRYTPIASLPALPASLTNLYLDDAASITCLPVLPAGLYGVTLGGSGVTCLPNIPVDLNLNPGALGIPPIVCDVTGACPLATPLITGTVFRDLDFNGVLDVGEPGRPNSLVIAQPGDLLTVSDANGDYVLPADIGTYAVTGTPLLYQPLTTAPYTLTLTAPGDVAGQNDVGYRPGNTHYDLTTEIVGNNVRPGFPTAVWITVHNVGTVPTTAEVALTIDAALSYTASSIVPATVNGSDVQWSVAALQPGATWTVRVDLYTPPSVPLGTAIVQQATATPSVIDETPADNTALWNDIVVGSFDPNDKLVTPTSLTLEDVQAGGPVEYTVRFQNTGTFPAERVLITDTLSADLQWSTMQPLGSSHACTWYIRQGVLHVLFNGIDLPDSTSDEAGSHGFFSFSIVPSAQLTLGASVDNVANIYFDFNEPVITEAATVTVEINTSVAENALQGLRAWPVPADEQITIIAAGPVNAQLRVFDASGRVVLEQRMQGERANIEVGILASGVYHVQCATSGGLMAVRFTKR